MEEVIPDNGDGTPLYYIKPYPEKDWQWITQHYPRRMWGMRVAYVAEANTDPKTQGWFYRLISWWGQLPGKWLP